MGHDLVYEMRCLFVAMGLNARFIVLPHRDNKGLSYIYLEVGEGRQPLPEKPLLSGKEKGRKSRRGLSYFNFGTCILCTNTAFSF